MKVEEQSPLSDYSRRPGMPQHDGSRVQLVQSPALNSDKSHDACLLLTSDPDSDIGDSGFNDFSLIIIIGNVMFRTEE